MWVGGVVMKMVVVMGGVGSMDGVVLGAEMLFYYQSGVSL